MNIKFPENNEEAFNKHGLCIATHTITCASLNHVHQQTESDSHKPN